jgi:type IV pilus assembly protein PilN
MIRINLLGLPKPKKGKRGGGGPVMTVEGPSILIIAAVLFAIAAGGSYFWYNQANVQHEKLTTQLRDAEVRIKQLSTVKAKYEEKDKQAKMLQKRFDVIDQLRAAQKGPVDLLATLSDTVNSSDAVWLKTMRDEGNNVTLEGTALSNVALANLMTNLKKGGYFKNVELKETAQEDFKNVQAFNFTLVCEKASPKKA